MNHITLRKRLRFSKQKAVKLFQFAKKIHRFVDDALVCLFVFVALRPSQQLWSLRDGQFT